MTSKESYFSFWKKSTNEHGVHSPFVFCLLTKGLYPKDNRWRKFKKRHVFFDRIYRYFKPSTLTYINPTSDILERGYEYVDFASVQGKVDLIFIGQGKGGTSISDSCIIDAMHNDSILIIDRRVDCESTEKLWKSIVEDDNFTVTIDFYYFGLAFIRKEQLKQHFVLRM
ncbi:MULTISPECIES: hypothetical protein [Myroides]|uniref:hypothetical protein n=1 Tax=Myroides TaxID=76831 RepID=UPI001328D128|nr:MULTISPECIES: hypothetical protein [Myroides]MVX34733.1 hypothetical protein [Myroides sp. LoEW2-1]UVD78621.1 hypothetical protein NWE55_10855 [Myroides albus]